MGLFGYRGGGDKPRKKQVINYDKQGNVIGDDGFEMTPTRKRMHRIFDGWFIYTFVMVVIGLVLMILAYTQGAQYTSWELVQVGGNQFNGWDTALLMRVEALLCLYSAVFAALISIFGFRWLYDKGATIVINGMLFALGSVSVGYFAYGLIGVGAPEPLSLVNISFILVTLLTMSAVRSERPTLRKPKVGRREIK
jgi:hypothetical protein